MKPLTQFEIGELMAAMHTGIVGAPIGSLWTNTNIDSLFLVLFHANSFNGEPVIVFQNIPDGACWTISAKDFFEGHWINAGFVWDRSVTE